MSLRCVKVIEIASPYIDTEFFVLVQLSGASAKNVSLLTIL